MPSVNSSTESTLALTRSLSELEQDLRADHKRARERAKQEVDDAEEAYKRSLAKRDQDYETTITDLKSTATEDLRKERLTSKAQLDDLKKETYNRLGNFHGADTQVFNDRYNQLKQETDEHIRADKRMLDEAEARLENRLEEQQQQHQKDLETMNEKTREAAERAYSDTIRSQKEEFADYKELADKRYRNLVRESQDNLNYERRKNEKAISDTQADLKNNLGKASKLADSRSEKTLRESNQRASESVDLLRKSHGEEASELHRQIQDLHQELDRGPKDRAQGMQQAIASYENEFKNREAQIVSQTEAEIAKTKEKSDQLARHYQEQNSQNINERNRFFTDLITKKNQEVHEDKKDLLASFDRARLQQEEQLKNERKQAQIQADHVADVANETRTEALQAQATAFQDTLARNQKAHDEEKSALEKALNEAGAPHRATDHISPRAEAALRKSVVNDYEKTLASEKERHQRAIASVQENYAHRLTSQAEESMGAQAQIHREHISAQELERRGLLNQIQDTEFNKAESLRNKETETARQTELLNQSYASMLERQRRSYEEAIQTLKNDTSYKLSAQRQDAEFELKNTRREYNALHNQIVRDHEKKMSEFKAQYEAQIEDLKSQSNLALRDMEKKGKLSLDEQARTYEQRLTQLEQQHKEHERYLSESFQEQIEKVKRSNALNYAKKG